MYPALPEIPSEKHQETGQFLCSTVAAQPAHQTIPASPPPIIQLPATIQQSFTSDAAIGLHYQMSSEFYFSDYIGHAEDVRRGLKCMRNVRAAIIRSNASTGLAGSSPVS